MSQYLCHHYLSYVALDLAFQEQCMTLELLAVKPIISINLIRSVVCNFLTYYFIPKCAVITMFWSCRHTHLTHGKSLTGTFSIYFQNEHRLLYTNEYFKSVVNVVCACMKNHLHYYNDKQGLLTLRPY